MVEVCLVLLTQQTNKQTLQNRTEKECKKGK